MKIETGHLITLAVVLAIMGAVAMLATIAQRHERTTRKVWEQFAEQRGVAYLPREKSGESPRIEGLLDGRAYAMFETDISSGSDSTRIVTRMHLSPRGIPDGLTVCGRSSGQVGKAMEAVALEIAGKLGGRVPGEVETGDAAFDEKWTVRAFDADAVRAWFALPSRREALLEVARAEHFSVIENAIRWEGSTPRTTEKITRLVSQLEDYAKRFEGGR